MMSLSHPLKVTSCRAETTFRYGTQAIRKQIRQVYAVLKYCFRICAPGTPAHRDVGSFESFLLCQKEDTNAATPCRTLYPSSLSPRVSSFCTVPSPTIRPISSNSLFLQSSAGSCSPITACQVTRAYPAGAVNVITERRSGNQFLSSVLKESRICARHLAFKDRARSR
jgi:hypothetical protein